MLRGAFQDYVPDQAVAFMPAQQVTQVREHAERRIAQLNSRLQGLQSRVHQLGEENRALSQAAAAARGQAPPAAAVQVRRVPVPIASYPVSCMPSICALLSPLCSHVARQLRSWRPSKHIPTRTKL